MSSDPPALVSHSGITPAPASELDSDLLPLYLLRFDRSQTRRAYRNDLTQFFGGEFVTLRMARLVTFKDVNEHIERLQEEGLKPASLRRKISSIRGFFEWLKALGLSTQNPADRQVIRRVHRNAKSQGAITVLTQEQAHNLILAAEMHGEAAVRDRTLLTVMLHCVLRRSEAAAMDVEHLRPSGPYWILNLEATKGGSQEYVKVPAHVVEEIHSHCEHYAIERGPLWRSLSRNDSRGNRLSPAAIYEIVRRAARCANGVSDSIGAHTLRHTGCTLAIEAGASAQQVQTHARHKRLETTMGYIHQRDKLRHSAADFIKL